MQLMTGVVPRLQALSREGEYGRTRINQYTRYLTVPLALLQAYGYLAILSSQTGIVDRLRHPEPGHADPDGHPAGRHDPGDVDRRTDHRARHRQRHQLHHLCRHRGARAAGRRRPTSSNPDIAGGIAFVILALVVVAVIVYIQEGQRRIPIQYAAASAAGACTRVAPRSCRCASTRPASSRSSSRSASCCSRRRSRPTSQTPPGTPPEQLTIVNQIADGHRQLPEPAGHPVHHLLLPADHGLHVLLHGLHVQAGRDGRPAAQERRLHPGHPAGRADARLPVKGGLPLSLAGAFFLAIVAVSPLILPASFPARLRCRRLRPRRHGAADRGVGGGRDDEADRGAADDAQLRGLHPLKVYVMVGGPGAGKGTQAALAGRATGPGPRRQSGDLFRDNICAKARRSARRSQELHRARRAGARRPDHPMVEQRARPARRRRGRHPRRLPAHARAGRGARRDARSAGQPGRPAVLYRRCRPRRADPPPVRPLAVPRKTTEHVYHADARRPRWPASATSTARRSYQRDGRQARDHSGPPGAAAAADVRGRRLLRRHKACCSTVDGDQPIDEVTDALLRAIAQPATLSTMFGDRRVTLKSRAQIEKMAVAGASRGRRPRSHGERGQARRRPHSSSTASPRR